MIDVANHVLPSIGRPMLDAATNVSARTGISHVRNRTYAQQSYGAETAGERGKNPNVDYNRDGVVRDTYAFDHAHPSRERRDAVIGYGTVEYGLQTLDKLASWLVKWPPR